MDFSGPSAAHTEWQRMQMVRLHYEEVHRTGMHMHFRRKDSTKPGRQLEKTPTEYSCQIHGDRS